MGGGGVPEKGLPCLPPFPRLRVPAVNVLPLRSKYTLHCPAWDTGRLLPCQLAGCSAVGERALKGRTEGHWRRAELVPASRMLQPCPGPLAGSSQSNGVPPARFNPAGGAYPWAASRSCRGYSPSHRARVAGHLLIGGSPQPPEETAPPWTSPTFPVRSGPEPRLGCPLLFCPFLVLCLGTLSSDFPLWSSFIF